MAEPLEFPQNIVDILKVFLKEQYDDEGWSVVDRPLRPADPAKSIGVYAYDWQPTAGSEEIGPLMGPTLATYLIRVQLLVKHSKEEEARAMYTVVAKNMRTMLARDPELRVRLAALSEVDLSATERVHRWGVRSQRYLNNEIKGTFLYMATTDFFVQTGTEPVS